ncbi:MAG: Lrp/AsnC family transcriptional regulator [Proteobacteria bacterium]|nr:Lrp/AsnC family transcriptional regulator [Pseudomonadota bacterium]
MKITVKERKILARLQAHADEPLREVARACGTTESTVRRVLSRGIDSGKIRRRVYVNLFALGLQQYAVYFAVPPKAVAQKAKMREVLLRAPFVELLIEVSGRYHFGAVLTVRSAFEFEGFFDFVTSSSNAEIVDLAVQVRTGWYYLGVRYLDGAVRFKPIEVVPDGTATTLSQSDAQALYAFSASADGNRAKMARDLGVPAATLQYQIESLHKRGAILGLRYQIAPELSDHRPFRVLITISHPLKAHRERIYQWAKQSMYVVSLMQGIGPWHYEIRLEAPDQVIASTVVDELVAACAEFIRSVELVPVVKVLKMQLHPDPALF